VNSGDCGPHADQSFWATAQVADGLRAEAVPPAGRERREKIGSAVSGARAYSRFRWLLLATVPSAAADRLARLALMEHFRTRRLIARDWAADDAQAAFDIYGRDEVMRWLGAQPRHPVASLAQMRERLDDMIERGSDEPDYGLWPVELRSGPAAGTVIGAVLLSRLPGPAGEVEIGWHLNPEHWGNGYATEGGRGAVGLAFGFSQVGPDAVELDGVGPEGVGPEGVGPEGAAGRSPLDRVIALVDPDNARSQAVCRRLGMRHLGQTDMYYGLVLELFELRRAEVVAGGP
jgi:RimJ/RimL family protein N-acetyltransferase